MENINLIYDYLDGNIQSQEEEKLFLMLSSSEEMRLEFRRQLAIKEAIRSDTKAFFPKAESTNAIFSSLGFNLPSNLIMKSSLDNLKNSFFKKYSQGLIAAICSSILTLIIVFLFLRNNTSDDYHLNLSEEKKQLSTSSQFDTNSNYSNNLLNPQKKNLSENKIIYKYIKIPTASKSKTKDISDNYELADELKNNKIISKSNEKTLQNLDESNKIEASNLILFTNKYPQNIDNLDFILPSYKLLNSLNFSLSSNNYDKLFSFEIKGNYCWYSSDVSIYPKEYSPFTNSSLGLFFALDESLLTGFELRQENFYQKYFENDSIGNLYLFEQQPNITSYNLGLRYRLKDIDSFYPLIQSSIGLANAGVIIRLTAGIEYQPLSTMSLILGLEFSNLFFYHTNTIYGSPKFGIFYGTSIKF